MAREALTNLTMLHAIRNEHPRRSHVAHAVALQLALTVTRCPTPLCARTAAAASSRRSAALHAALCMQLCMQPPWRTGPWPTLGAVATTPHLSMYLTAGARRGKLYCPLVEAAPRAVGRSGHRLAGPRLLCGGRRVGLRKGRVRVRVRVSYP